MCVKRKKRNEGRGGRRRDSCVMAWLSVSGGLRRVEADLQEVITGGAGCLSGC